MSIFVSHPDINTEIAPYITELIPGVNCLAKINLNYDSANQSLTTEVVSDEFLDAADKYCEDIDLKYFFQSINVFDELKANDKWELSEEELRNDLLRLGDFSAEFSFTISPVKYSLVYIDDNPETALTRYLDEEFQGENYEIVCSEIIFKPEDGYESLLFDQRVSSANIILIDSWLFENRTAANVKFTGEEFKLILKKLFPFIEVIVITQNGTDSEIRKIAKYDKSLAESASEYYASKLPKIINQAVADIQQYRLLADLVKENDTWEEVLKDKVIATLKGTNTYDKLTKEDIDSLILAFKEIQESLNG